MIRVAVWRALVSIVLALAGLGSAFEAHSAADFSVFVTRKDSNLYADGASRSLIQTVLCFEFAFADSATLHLSTPSSGTLTFSTGRSCTVTNVYVIANLTAGSIATTVSTAGSGDYYFSDDGLWAVSTIGCFHFVYFAPAAINLPYGAIGGSGIGGSLVIPSQGINCNLLDTVWTQRTASVGVPTAPDMVVLSVNADATGQAGQSLHVSFSSTNQGTAPAPAFRAKIYFSPTSTITALTVDSTYYCSFSGLAAGETQSCGGSVVVPATLAAGDYYVVVKADADGVVVESNEFNNAAASSTTTAISAAAADSLTVSKAGSGVGTVTSSDDSINCGAKCAGSPASGLTVTLDAVASFGSIFTGWSGACSGTGVCSVTMSSPQTVTAIFLPATSTHQMPWFTKVGGYISRFVLLNTSNSGANYSIGVGTEPGNTVKLKPGKTSGVLAPGAQTVVNVDDFVDSFSGAQRGFAFIGTNAPAMSITGIYNLVQPATGAISNVSLIPSDDIAATSTTLVAPWVTTDIAYRGDLVLTNQGASDVTASISYLPPRGGAVGSKLTSIVIPAKGQVLTEGTTLASVVGASSFGAVLQIPGSPSQIKGTYKVFNRASGAASSTELTQPAATNPTTTLIAPWFSIAGGYDSRFILTNRGANPAGFTVKLLPEPGNAVTVGVLSGAIPAGGQVTIPANTLLKSTSGPPRASAVFEVSAAADAIDGIYQIVSTGTGAISNTVLAKPSQSAATTTTLRLPWFSSVDSYISRFVLVNRGATAASFTLEVKPETDNNVTTQLIRAGTIAANSQLVLPVGSVVSGFSRATRASAVFQISAPEADIEGLYNIVNPISGSISNTLMAR